MLMEVNGFGHTISEEDVAGLAINFVLVIL